MIGARHASPEGGTRAAPTMELALHCGIGLITYVHACPAMASGETWATSFGPQVNPKGCSTCNLRGLFGRFGPDDLNGVDRTRLFADTAAYAGLRVV